MLSRIFRVVRLLDEEHELEVVVALRDALVRLVDGLADAIGLGGVRLHERQEEEQLRRRLDARIEVGILPVEQGAIQRAGIGNGPEMPRHHLFAARERSAFEVEDAVALGEKLAVAGPALAACICR